MKKCIKTHVAAADTVENEENVIQWNWTEQVEEEPGLDVVLGDQLRVDDHLFAVVLLHDAWNDKKPQATTSCCQAPHIF